MFTASDGTTLDIKADLAPRHRAILVVWPCMAGSTAMYRLPVKDFSSVGISTVQFNPRGHGRSGGEFELETCIADLREYMGSLHIDDTPLWMMGHSAGASLVLKYGTRHNTAARYILVSPVLDSRGSYVHLYDTGMQEEANVLIAALTSDRSFMLTLLADNRWMDPAAWTANSYRERINSISGSALAGSLMQRLFIEGFNAHADLEHHAKKTSIILPVQDNWYPMDLTNSLAYRSGIPVETIHEAKDHYFTGAWKFVWQRVLEEMDREINA